MSDSKPRAAVVTLRFTLLGALTGLPIGLLEAARLYFVPRQPLLHPDVTYVIWFLAPLVDMAVAGLLGLLISLAAMGLRRSPAVVARIAAVVAGVLAAVSACLVALVVSPVRAGRIDPPASWWWFFVTFAGVLAACYFEWHRGLGRRLRAGDALSPRTLSITLLTAVAVLLSGVLVFEVEHRYSPTSVNAGSRPAAGKPNVVFITIDTVRADHLSLYGYGRPTSPSLERWARQGVVFDRAISASSWTLPSHASLFTGLLPHQHGANWFTPLDTSRWTLAEVLRAYGYETAGFAANAYVLEAGWGMAQGFQRYEDASQSIGHNLGVTFAGDRLLQPVYSSLVRPDRMDRVDAAEMNRDVSSWFERRASGKPYFLFINYIDAHGPYLAPPPYDSRFGRVSQELVRRVHPMVDVGTTSVPLSTQERESLTNAYDNCISYVDHELDELLRFLSSQPEWNNTVVVITSDHGEAFGEHGYYGHGEDLHMETLHVPLVMLGPGIPEGLRVTRVVGTRKVFSTVLDLALGLGEPFHSHSLRRAWDPDPTPGVDAGVAVSEFVSRWEGRPASISLTTSEWQYIQDTKGRKELYRWAAPADSQVNLAGSFPEQAKAMQAFLRDRMTSSLGPWAEPAYLSALAPVGGPPMSGTAFALRSDLSPSLLHRVGITQAYFPPQHSALALHPPVADQDLLESLPYH